MITMSFLFFEEFFFINLSKRSYGLNYRNILFSECSIQWTFRLVPNLCRSNEV